MRRAPSAHLTAQSFWTTNKLYTNELRDLQARGYKGDGFWSAGHLVRGGIVQGDGVGGDVDQAYVCGGAMEKKGGFSRSTHRRRHYAGGDEGGSTMGGGGGKSRAEPSHRGPLKGKGPKAGARVTSKRAFAGAGDGHALSNDPTQSKFRKRAVSKNACVYATCRPS